MAKIFAKYDKEKKGYLDLSEFGTLLRSEAGDEFTEKEVVDIMLVIDSNRNRKVEQDELF